MIKYMSWPKLTFMEVKSLTVDRYTNIVFINNAISVETALCPCLSKQFVVLLLNMLNLSRNCLTIAINRICHSGGKLGNKH